MTDSFRVLDGTKSSDQAEWISLWNCWEHREVLAHPEYLKLFCAPHDQPVCAVWKDPEGCVLFPLICRPLDRTEWRIDGSYCDLTTPYGYGGPYRMGSVDEQVFWDRFDTWTKSRNVVSLFARLSLFPEQLIPFRGNIEQNTLNVIRDLRPGLDGMWMNYEHKVRKNVKRAQSLGLVCEIDLSGARLSEFLAVYYSTMDRRMAPERYYFSEEFFGGLIRHLAGSFAFFHLFAGGKMVATELVLISADNIYSFLGGTIEEAFEVRANDFLKHSIIEWGCNAKKKAFVLGGGFAGLDGIFRYKKSFAPQGEVPFMVGKRIYDQKTYDVLAARRLAINAERGTDWIPAPNYFPVYRA